MPIVTDDGFKSDQWNRAAQPVNGAPILVPLEAVADARAVEIDSDADIDDLKPYFPQLDLIGIRFPNYADGRGFSLAERLRRAGYEGRLRVVGDIVADQYGFARACGFDEAEISPELAERQPQEQWQRAFASTLSYRHKLGFVTR